MDEIEELMNADVIYFLCGAGFSSESNIPLFSDFSNDSLEFLNFSSLVSNKNNFFQFWSSFKKICQDNQPHHGYKLLADFLKSKQDYFAFTSNIDGHLLHFFDKNKIRECHGNINYCQCFYLCHEKRCKKPMKPPFECKFCERKDSLRPNICLYNDRDWLDNEEQKRALKIWKKNVLFKKQSDLRIVILEIGTGRKLRTVRIETETTFKRLKANGCNVSLVRVNSSEEDCCLEDKTLETEQNLYFSKQTATQFLDHLFRRL